MAAEGIIMKFMSLLICIAFASCQPLSSDTKNDNSTNQVISSGEALYKNNCASCHSGSVSKAPHRDMLGLMTAEYTLNALNEGIMMSQASHLELNEKIAISEYLADAPMSANKYKTPPKCEGLEVSSKTKKNKWTGWGGDKGNSRYAGNDQTSITGETIPSLKLKWSIEMPGGTRARSQPMISNGILYVGAADGRFMALEAKTGCLIWEYQARAEMRHAAFIDQNKNGSQIYFGDLMGHAYSLEAKTGKLIWTNKVDPHPNTTITASPVVYEDRVYFAVSALEVTSAADPNYECCTFRGSLVAYNKTTGEKSFQTYTIDEPASHMGKNDLGTKLYGPSGAPLWASLAVDPKRNNIYAGSGENYSSPGSDRSDAVIAFDMTSGEIKWTMQALEDDVWNMACMSDDPVVLQACPKENGPDYDFGAGIMYAELSDGQDMVIAGQKSGDLFFINPDNGKVINKQKVGRGGVQAGIHFGMARDNDYLYVPISDFPDGREPVELAKPGMFAISLKDKKQKWFRRDPNDVCNGRDFCTPGISAAATAFEGAVMAGSMDGTLRAYSKENGKVIWSYNTAKEFKTLTGQIAKGGSFGGSAGPVAHENMLYAVSGYGVYFHMPGAVLLAFEVE